MKSPCCNAEVRGCGWVGEPIRERILYACTKCGKRALLKPPADDGTSHDECEKCGKACEAPPKNHPGRWPVDREWTTVGGTFTGEDMQDVKDYIQRLEREVEEVDTERIHWMENYEGLERAKAQRNHSYDDVTVLWVAGLMLRTIEDLKSKEQVELLEEIVKYGPPSALEFLNDVRRDKAQDETATEEAVTFHFEGLELELTEAVLVAQGKIPK